MSSNDGPKVVLARNFDAAFSSATVGPVAVGGGGLLLAGATGERQGQGEGNDELQGGDHGRLTVGWAWDTLGSLRLGAGPRGDLSDRWSPK